MDTIGERVKFAREHGPVKMSRGALAKAVEIGYSTLADLENGYAATTVALHRIAKALKARVEWLERGKGPKWSSEPAAGDDVDWSDIKATTQGIGLGKGVEADEYAEAHRLKFRADSLRKKRLNAAHLEIAYGKGDSMEPRIHDGDAIMFDRSDTKPKDGALYVVQVAGTANHEPQAKRCLILDDLVYFEAINPAGDHDWKKARRMDSRRQPIEILGRVRWIAGWVD